MFNLVQYSDSSDDEDENVSKRPKLDSSPNQQSCLPKVPNAILTMFVEDDTCHEDIPENHDGRLRSFEHVRGSWASYIYYPVKVSSTLQDFIDDLLDVVNEDIDYNRLEDVHLSLSKTIVLRHHWIVPLRNQLTKDLSSFHPFMCEITNVKFYCNDQNTRTFIGLEIQSPQNKLKNIVNIIDNCLKEYDLPLYYENPSFHLSVGWTLGDTTSHISDRCKVRLQQIYEEHLLSNPQIFTILMNSVELKTGNDIFQIKFHN